MSSMQIWNNMACVGHQPPPSPRFVIPSYSRLGSGGMSGGRVVPCPPTPPSASGKMPAAVPSASTPRGMASASALKSQQQKPQAFTPTVTSLNSSDRRPRTSEGPHHRLTHTSNLRRPASSQQQQRGLLHSPFSAPSATGSHNTATANTTQPPPTSTYTNVRAATQEDPVTPAATRREPFGSPPPPPSSTAAGEKDKIAAAGPQRPQSAGQRRRESSALSSRPPAMTFLSGVGGGGGSSTLLGAGAANQLRTTCYNSITSLMLLVDACERYMDSIPLEKRQLPLNPQHATAQYEQQRRLRPSAISVLADIKCLRQAAKGELMQGFLKALKDLSSTAGGVERGGNGQSGEGGTAMTMMAGGGPSPQRPPSARGPRADIAAAAAVARGGTAEATHSPQPHHAPPIDGIIGGLLHCEMLLLASAALRGSVAKVNAELREAAVATGRTTSGLSSAAAAMLNAMESEEAFLVSVAAGVDAAVADIARVINVCAARFGGGYVVHHYSGSVLDKASHGRGSGSGGTNSNTNNSTNTLKLFVDSDTIEEMLAVFEARREALWANRSSSSNASTQTNDATSSHPTHAAASMGKFRRRLSASFNIAGGSASHHASSPPPPPPLSSVFGETAQEGGIVTSATLDTKMPFCGDVGAQTNYPKSSAPNAHTTLPPPPPTTTPPHAYLAARIHSIRRNRYATVLQWEEARLLFSNRQKEAPPPPRQQEGGGGEGEREGGRRWASGPTKGAGGGGFASSTTANVFAAFQKYQTQQQQHGGGGGSRGGSSSARPSTSGGVGGYRFNGSTCPPPPPAGGSSSARRSGSAASQSPSAILLAGGERGIGIVRPVPVAVSIQKDESQWAAFNRSGGVAGAVESINAIHHEGVTLDVGGMGAFGSNGAAAVVPWPDQLLEHAAALLKLRYDPLSGSLVKHQNVTSPTAVTISADNYQQLVDYLKVLQRRWHPDRFLHAVSASEKKTATNGGALSEEGGDGDHLTSPSSASFIVAKATRISQTINALREALNIGK